MGSLSIRGKFSCLLDEVLYCTCFVACDIFHLHFHSFDLIGFNLNLQVQPGDVCSQVGLCSAHRGQSKRSGVFPYCLLLLLAPFFLPYLFHSTSIG